MYTCPIQLKDVRYNAANQSFEAAITVHDNSTVRTYACTIEAPLSMRFEDAAKGLSKQAIRRHQHRGGLFLEAAQVTSHRQTRLSDFDPARWLHELIRTPGRQAA